MQIHAELTQILFARTLRKEGDTTLSRSSLQGSRVWLGERGTPIKLGGVQRQPTGKVLSPKICF